MGEVGGWTGGRSVGRLVCRYILHTHIVHTLWDRWRGTTDGGEANARVCGKTGVLRGEVSYCFDMFPSKYHAASLGAATT